MVPPARGGRNQLRIIGGRWRSRRLPFAPLPALRPTPDRVRETLFNWLAPVISGARCLDLFAGSGALGMEALSRGAAAVCFVEADAVCVATLRDNLARLDCHEGDVVQADVMAWLQGAPRRHDIVFVDPPYHGGLLGPVCERLAAGWVATGSLIYMERAADEPPPPLPAGWRVRREKRAGQVAYTLLEVAGDGV